MKVVTLLYLRWAGLVTYTGVGKWRGRDTAEWVVDWLTDSQDASPDVVIDLLREKGTKFIRAIEQSPRGRRHRHTFVLAAFVNEIPHVATIANFEDSAGRSLAVPAADLSVDLRRMRGRPLLGVTGQKPAVRRPSRRRLERLAERSGTSPARIRSALADMNAEAAAAPESGGTVSVACTVVSFRRDGSGFQNLTPGSRARQRVLMNGAPLPEVLGSRPGVLRGASFGRFGPDTKRQSYPPRVPRTITPTDASGYELTELTHPEFAAAAAHDVNGRGSVIGSGTRAGQPGTHLPCMWSNDGSASLVGITGRPAVRGLNENGDVALTGSMMNNSVHAARWSPGGEVEDLGTYFGTDSDEFADSGATAINDTGMVVGWVSLSTDPRNRGQGNYRPAAWLPGRAPIFLIDFGFAWGQAVDVNDAGTVLIVAYTDSTKGTSKALLWDPVADALAYVGDDKPDGVYPMSLTAEGVVLGNAKGRTSESIPCVARADERWTRVGTPDGWHATTMNDVGDVAGSHTIEGFARPWLRRANGSVVWLPYFEHHHCRPSSLTATGLLVGTAQTDHGTHALLWQPPSD